jgi:hypothetical protein
MFSSVLSSGASGQRAIIAPAVALAREFYETAPDLFKALSETAHTALEIARILAHCRVMTQNSRKIVAGLAAASLLSGCGWFDGGGPAPHSQGARPGVDRTARVSNALPPPPGSRPHESGAAPADETRSGATVGSLVTGKGGQKAQKDEAEKQLEEQSKKERERAERAAQERKLRTAREKEASASPGAPASEPGQSAPAATAPATVAPAAAEPAAAEPAAQPPSNQN